MRGNIAVAVATTSGLKPATSHEQNSGHEPQLAANAAWRSQLGSAAHQLAVICIAISLLYPQPCNTIQYLFGIETRPCTSQRADSPLMGSL
jgi:hypothetical protein